MQHKGCPDATKSLPDRLRGHLLRPCWGPIACPPGLYQPRTRTCRQSRQKNVAMPYSPANDVTYDSMIRCLGGLGVSRTSPQDVVPSGSRPHKDHQRPPSMQAQRVFYEQARAWSSAHSVTSDAKRPPALV